MIVADRCSVNDIAEREAIAERRPTIWMNFFREQVSAYKHYKHITIRASSIRECFVICIYVAIFCFSKSRYTR